MFLSLKVKILKKQETGSWNDIISILFFFTTDGRTKTDKKDILLTVKIFVETGANNDEEIEITKGLSIGDIIVLEGANNVEDNQRVRVIE